MNYRIAALLLLLFIASYSQAQSTVADSLSVLARICSAKKDMQDTACLRLMNTTARAWFKEQELDSCLAWAERSEALAVSLARTLPDGTLDPHRIANEKLLSMANYFASRYPESISHALKLEQIATRMGDTATQAAAMNYQGYCYRGMGENRRAYNITLNAVRLLEQLPPGPDLSNAYDGIAVLCKDLNLTDSAKYYQRLAIAIPNDNPGNTSNSLLAMAEYHMDESAMDSAAFYIAKAEGLIQDQSPVSIAHFYGMRGKVRFFQHEYDAALSDLNVADSISTAMENNYELTYIHQLQSLCLAGLGGTKNAFDMGTKAMNALVADMDIAKAQELTETRMRYEQEQKDALTRLEHDKVKNQRLFAVLGALLLAVIAALLWNGARRSRASARMLHVKNEELIISHQDLLRTEKALSTQAVRTHVAQDIHDELGSQLTKIGLLSREALYARTNYPEELPDLLSSIDRISLSTNSTLSDVVWNTDPHNDLVSALLDRAVEYAQRMVHDTDIELHYDRELRMEDRDVQPDWRRNAMHIVKEAINNTLKYAKATELHLGLVVEEDKLVLEIKDNGKGFDAATARNGNGLRNMRERTERVGGTFTMSSDPSGTTIKAVLPLP